MEEEKKAERKRKRFAVRLKTYKGIISTDVPQPSLVLYNAGQATGLEKESIIKMLKENSIDVSIPKLISEKGQSHSFLVFRNVDEATTFLNKCNGKAKTDESGNPLYISYVENVPNNETICQHENPKDLTLLNDFITNDEEKQFITLFNWTEDIDSSKLKNRQVKHYGYEFRYGSNDVDLNDPLSEKIPELCDVLWRRLMEHGFDLGVPDQLTVNKYRPGEGIPSHVDKHSPFGDTILSLSLGSSIVMDWKHHTGKYVPVVVPPRSMMIMQGEARYDWQHGIQARNWDPIIEIRETSNSTVKVITTDTKPRGTRISLTFRWTREGPCMCEYRTLCDSAGSVTTDDIQGELANNLEDLHVHQVYEQIACHFSTTRHKPWPQVVEFMRRVAPGALVLDLGCGNGKNVLQRHDIVQLAGERSSGLLRECKQHIQGISGADCVRLDLLYAGLKDACADFAICIAVIHHFCSQARRLQAISTITRLLKPGGRALITVWAKDQTKSNYLCKNKEQSSNEIVSVGGLNLPVHENRTQFQHKDLLVPWKLRKVNNNKLEDSPYQTLLRYYHVFEENELVELCNQVPNINVENSFYEEGNWCVIINKMT